MHRIVRLSITAIARTVVMKPCQRSIPLCSLYQHNNITINQLSHSSFSTIASQIGTEEEVAELTAWAPTFTKASLPLDKFDVRNARSRGAGGQNVNKGSSTISTCVLINQSIEITQSIDASLSTICLCMPNCSLIVVICFDSDMRG